MNGSNSDSLSQIGRIDFGPITHKYDENDKKATQLYHKHLLNYIIKNWKINTRKKKLLQYNEVQLMRWKIERFQFIFFRKWKNLFKAKHLLMELAINIKLSKTFFLWIYFVRSRYINKYNFGKVIIARRKIYYKKYFQQWKYGIQLKKKYNYYSRNENRLLQLKIIKGFFISIEKTQMYNEAVQRMEEIRLYGAFINWHKHLKFLRLTRYYLRRHISYSKQYYFYEWYDRMKFKVSMKRRARSLSNNIQKRLIQNFFDSWYDKYHLISSLNSKYKKLYKIIHHKVLFKSFYKLISLHNKNIFLEKAKAELEMVLVYCKTQYYFFLWKKQKYIKCKSKQLYKRATKNIYCFKLNYYFSRWKSKHYTINHYRFNFDQVQEMEKRIILTKYINNWYGEYRYVSTNRAIYQKAVKFRSLCLKLKSFRTLQNYVFFRRLERRRIRRVNRAVLRRFFKHWVQKHIKYRRRYILISSVVKCWAFSLKKKIFTQWTKYIVIKNEKQKEYVNAKMKYYQNRISYVIDSFVAGCPQITIETPLPIEPSNKEMNFSHGNLEINSENIFVFKEKLLDDPTLPTFMKGISSPDKRTETYLRRIENRFNELASMYSLNISNASNRAEMLSLIREMNRIHLME